MNLELLKFLKKRLVKQAPKDREELVLEEGTRQLRKLIHKGLRVPVVLL